MMQQHITAYPLTWPQGWKRTRTPEPSRFGKWNKPVTVNKATSFVLAELARMGIPADAVIISTNVKLRQDGLPYSNRREPDDKGVSVWWMDGPKQLVIAIDKYDRIADNLYAIGKTIEAIRGIDRWGSGEILERTFTGFEALPHQPAETWWETLSVQAHTPTEEVERAYRRARFRAHPDQGGSTELFQKVNEAFEAFRAERGLQ